MADDSTTIEFCVLGVEPVTNRGRLAGLAVVAIQVAGIEFVLQGIQIRRHAGGGLAGFVPQFRHPDGRWLPAVLLPPELKDAMAREIAHSYTAAVEAAGCDHRSINHRIHRRGTG
jgi:hypothetical protein